MNLIFFLKSHLCLRESQRGSQLGSLRQRQVLCVLKPPLQGGQLEAGVDRPGFPHFLRLTVHHPHLRLAYLFFCGKKTKTKITTCAYYELYCLLIAYIFF